MSATDSIEKPFYSGLKTSQHSVIDIHMIFNMILKKTWIQMTYMTVSLDWMTNLDKFSILFNVTRIRKKHSNVSPFYEVNSIVFVN